MKTPTPDNSSMKRTESISEDGEHTSGYHRGGSSTKDRTGWVDKSIRERQVHAPCPPPDQTFDIQVVLALEGLAADFAHVFPLLAVCQVVLAQGTGAAEHLPTQAAVQERVLRGTVLPLAFPCTPSGPASFISLFRHLECSQTQV